jgi:hypothetical protein
MRKPAQRTPRESKGIVSDCAVSAHLGVLYGTGVMLGVTQNEVYATWTALYAQ